MATIRAWRRRFARKRRVRTKAWRARSESQGASGAWSYLGPVTNEIVIDAAQFDRFGVVAPETLYQRLNRVVEVKDHAARPFVADHALQPEKRRHTGAARDRCHHVQTRSRIKYQVPGGQFDLVRAVIILNDQLGAIIFIRFGEKQRHRHVGTNAQAGHRIAAHRVVYMNSKVMAGSVAVEQGREDMQRNGGRNKQRA